MAFLQRIPKLLRWIFSVLLFFIVVMSLCRLVFFWKYHLPGVPLSGKAMFLGLRYDVKFASMLSMAMLLLCTIPFLNPFKNSRIAGFWNILLTSVFVLMIIVYAADFYHYDYLQQRLNATVLNYLQDAGISFSMMWQTYPLLKILLLLILLLILSFLFFRWLLFRFQTEDGWYKRRNIPAYIISFLLLAFFMVGKVIYRQGQFPLRWSDAFTFNNKFKSNLALNPFQSFFSSLKFRNSSFDEKKVREYYPLMASYLDVQNMDSANLNFERKNIVPDTFTNKPNIVLVICESFSAYKSSMYGNPLNTTPYFNSLCSKGVFFDRCFTPAYGTARGVWAVITGMPDVAIPGTASRNPNAVDQHTIINDFSGYSNFYFLGGNATWANVRGLLTNNIGSLHLYEQDDYKAKPIDVWGISDKNLFLEANNVLKEQTKPFFAVIQTADNHRPYTIPAEDEAVFTKKEFPKDTLRKYGFESNAEMNAFRYTDFCYEKFIAAAQKEKYFDNTIFVFVGDHGIRGNAGNMFPKTWTEQGLTCEHVPLLFYSPKYLQPNRISSVCSQADVLPSVAALAKVNYTNTTFGRNLFDSSLQLYSQQHYAFIIDHDEAKIGLVSNDYYFQKSITAASGELFSVKDNNPVPDNDGTRKEKEVLNKLTTAWYETSRYLLFNNKKKEKP